MGRFWRFWHGQDIWDLLETPQKETTSLKIKGWNPNNPPIFPGKSSEPNFQCWVPNVNFPCDSLAEASSLPLATSGEDTPCSLRIRSYLASVISFSGRSIVGQMDGVCVDVVCVKLLTLNPFNGNYPGFYLGGLAISRIGSCPPSWTKLTLRQNLSLELIDCHKSWGWLPRVPLRFCKGLPSASTLSLWTTHAPPAGAWERGRRLVREWWMKITYLNSADFDVSFLWGWKWTMENPFHGPNLSHQSLEPFWNHSFPPYQQLMPSSTMCEALVPQSWASPSSLVGLSPLMPRRPLRPSIFNQEVREIAGNAASIC